MYTDIDKKLMLKFLERNYPVSRIKDKQRFKRAIVIDNDTIYYLSDQTSHKQLKFSLVEILQKIFNWAAVVALLAELRFESGDW